MQMWIKILLILVLCSVCQAAQIIRYVDPDVVAGDSSGDSWINAYASLSAWEAAEETDLDTANNYMTVYCRSLSGTQDTTSCTISGWTTSATDYIEIIGADFPANGIYDGTKYVLHNNDSDQYALLISEEYVRLHNIQVAVTGSGANDRRGIGVFGVGTANIYIDSCYIKGFYTGTGVGTGINSNDADLTLTIYNTIISDFVSGTDSNFSGITNTNSTNTYMYNCTVTNCRYAVERGDGTMTAKNCAVFNNYDDFAGTITIDYCASDDGNGTNAVDISPQPVEATEWNKAFTNYAAGDYSVKDADSVLYNAGLADLFAEDDDIIGTARPQGASWDIGAFEYVAAAPAAGGQVIMIQEF